MARYAIGDIQGCKASLYRLLDNLGYSASRDRSGWSAISSIAGRHRSPVLRWAIAQGDASHDGARQPRPALARARGRRRTGEEARHARRRARRARPRCARSTGAASTAAPCSTARWRWSMAASIPAGRSTSPPRSHARSKPASRPTLEERARRDRRHAAALGAGDDRRRSHAGRARVSGARAHVEARRARRSTTSMEHSGDAPTATFPWFAFPDAAWRTHTIVFGHWAALASDRRAPRRARHRVRVGEAADAYELDTGVVTQVKAVEKSD